MAILVLRSNFLLEDAARKKDAAASSSAGGRNKFEDLPSPLLPPAIPSWRTALENYDPLTARFRYNELVPSDLGYVFPEPALFLSMQSPDRQKAFFSTWLKYRSAFIYRVSSGSFDVQPMPNKVWRTVLSGDFTAKARELNGAPPTRSRKLKETADDFLQGCLNAEGVTVDVPDDNGVLPAKWNGKDFSELGNQEYEQILWELSELNFRFELMALDSRATTEPEHSPRQELISDCFPRSKVGESLLVVDLACVNHGLAALSWTARSVYVLALQKVMSSWRGDLPPIIKKVKYAWTIEEGAELEQTITKLYCATFYEYFRRAPIVPRRLSHTVFPFFSPLPPKMVIEQQHPRPNIIYDPTALSL